MKCNLKRLIGRIDKCEILGGRQFGKFQPNCYRNITGTGWEPLMVQVVTIAIEINRLIRNSKPVWNKGYISGGSKIITIST